MLDLYSFWIGIGSVVALYVIIQGLVWLERRARQNMQAWEPKRLQEGVDKAFKDIYHERIK